MPREASRVSQRRKFKVQSEFGNARGWRSRKNRPCDVCRKRKTACVITSTPPCLFCKGRGLECKSSTGAAAASASVPTASIAASLSGLADERAIGLVSGLIPPEGGPENPVNLGVEEVHDIVGTPDESDRPVTGSVAFTGHTPSSPYTANHVQGRYGQDASDPSAAFRPDDIEIWSLEDKENRTAHSMGPAAEQDTHLLASFRSDILSGPTDIDAEFVQVYEGSQYPWDPPVHFCILQDEFAAHDDEVKAAASRAIEDLVVPHGPLLVKLYFRHVHPVFPILSKAPFLTQYSGDKTKLPASLRGAVYALASVFWESEPSSHGPFSFQQHELADLAADSLQRELDSPNLAKLQASLLLLHMMPNRVDSIAHPKTWTSTAQAVASAQMIGLHQDAEKWNIPKCEKRLRRKLWWATYVTDVWSAICHGNPPHIYPASFNTSNITMEDLRNDETVPEELRHFVDPSCVGIDLATGARFLELVKLSQALHELIDCSFQVPRLLPPQSRNGETERRRRQLALQDELHGWQMLLPQCLAISSPGKTSGSSNNAPLHLAYYAYLALLYRALMSPATKIAKSTSSSSLCQWFSTALVKFESFTKFMNIISLEDLKGFWGRHARSQLVLCGNFLIYLFLLASEAADVTCAFRLIEGFHESLQRLKSQSEPTYELLILPVSLRIESFFTQAADRLRGPSLPRDAVTPSISHGVR
ncbi:hypothetical protein CDEST_14358 [Colletotrichum destructivum]|uniref:Zn(2)-C6 fungal-type domain-containing protein n=1 Tax=Colletotrichum destructivum TaxID=34406 RepID=A0AAX4J1L6_9PEZI|nr:hypothetical protein CDEST_14358 [Colletotrichum destructivum]